jgi:diacylglycerol kinase
MTQDIFRSARYAFRGLRTAVQSGRNLQLFLVSYLLLVLYASLLPLSSSEWLALLVSGGLFLITELLNTALEHLADAVDDHLKGEHRKESFTAIKMAKDIAASASLVSLLLVGMVAIAIVSVHIRL